MEPNQDCSVKSTASATPKAPLETIEIVDVEVFVNTRFDLPPIDPTASVLTLSKERILEHARKRLSLTHLLAKQAPKDSVFSIANRREHRSLGTGL